MQDGNGDSAVQAGQAHDQANMKANRHSQTTSSVKPVNAASNGGWATPLRTVQAIAWLSIRSNDMPRPAMPSGMASDTHIMLAQNTMPSTDRPAGESPAGAGNSMAMTRDPAQAMP